MLFVANYKMNGDKNFYKKVERIFNKSKFEDTVVLCPPFVYMPFLNIQNKNVLLASQDISVVNNNKSTGQISAQMLKEFNVKYSIVGHSERRAMGETNELIAQKVKNAVENDIIPIICVGEVTKSAKLDVLIEQVKIALSLIENGNIIFAYEPVWAIGTGEVPTVSQINKAIKIIRKACEDSGFEVKVLYGGSVNKCNQKELKTSIADGFLMGGVSLKLDEFVYIVRGE